MNEKIIWEFLKSKGFCEYGIAGLMGNLKAESNLRPNNLQNTYEKSLGLTDEEYTKRVNNGTYTNFIHDKAGYGLAQWTWYSRKESLLNYSKSINKSIDDLNMQLEFLYKELKGYKEVFKTLTNCNSVRQASDIVLVKFEAPANQGEEVKVLRASYGQEFYNKFSKKEVNSKMKYNDNNKPLVCMQTNSTCYKGTSKMEVKGVLWHSTGCNNPNIKRYVQPSDNASDKAEMLNIIGLNAYRNDWNHIEHQAGLNAWIGKLNNGTISTVQTMPWDYRPWGCGSGSKGSCNSGWIQFEICEDDLNNVDYFNTVYKEAVELTAYLCKMYNINPYGTVYHNGVNAPTILCHQDSYKLGLGGNHGDVYHWFNKYGKTMDDVRKDVNNLINSSNDVVTNNKPAVNTQQEDGQLYRVRKSWEDAKSQTGAYKILENAKKNCLADYKVFNKDGQVVYEPKAETKEEYKTYTVKHGDSLWSIAEKFLGKGELYPEIKKLNNLSSNVIYSGTVLKLYKVETTEPKQEDNFILYEVKDTDTLWGISTKYYKNGSKYNIIMIDNNLKSTVIHKGQILKIRK